MNPFEFIIAILVIVFGARVLRDVLRHRAATGVSGADPNADRLRDEVRQLRERVQVLERVVTDSNPTAELNRRIERLRD